MKDTQKILNKTGSWEVLVSISINPVSNIQDILSFLIVITPKRLDHDYFRHQEIQVYFLLLYWREIGQ